MGEEIPQILMWEVVTMPRVSMGLSDQLSSSKPNWKEWTQWEQGCTSDTANTNCKWRTASNYTNSTMQLLQNNVIWKLAWVAAISVHFSLTR